MIDPWYPANSRLKSRPIFRSGNQESVEELLSARRNRLSKNNDGAYLRRMLIPLSTVRPATGQTRFLRFLPSFSSFYVGTVTGAICIARRGRKYYYRFSPRREGCQPNRLIPSRSLESCPFKGRTRSFGFFRFFSPPLFPSFPFFRRAAPRNT